jgi:heme-degrading monooxygenase HmoA
MIIRSWRARATAANAVQYIEHAQAAVFPALSQIPGHRGAMLLRSDRAGDVEILVLTAWGTMDEVAAFAGADIGKAVVDPEAQAVLTDYDRTVAHYDVVAATGALRAD